VIDDFRSGDFKNLHGYRGDLVAADLASLDWRAQFGDPATAGFDAIFHLASITDTTVHDQFPQVHDNVESFRGLLRFAQPSRTRIVYASSGATYGVVSGVNREDNEAAPANVYAFSKVIMDNLARRAATDDPEWKIVGLRYFNVYGPREAHKARMASVAYHFFNQYRAEGRVKLFEGSGGYEAGEQRRDFVSVDDVVGVNLHFMANPDSSGIFNVGTGRAQTFNEVAVATINALRSPRGEDPLSLQEMLAKCLIEYVAFPAGLRERYQSFTQADLSQLRRIGYKAPFQTVEKGVTRYIAWLLAQS
jgi:ADP-L-glycero-D-manno-heptose 6-epimerase